MNIKSVRIQLDFYDENLDKVAGYMDTIIFTNWLTIEVEAFKEALLGQCEKMINLQIKAPNMVMRVEE